MSDTEIRVWFCVFLLSIITLFALVAYLLATQPEFSSANDLYDK